MEGTVRNLAGKPVAGAAVELEDTRSLNVRSYLTGKDGKYHFNELYSNVEYRLRASYHDVFGPPHTLGQFTGHKATVDLTVPERGGKSTEKP